MSDTPNLLAELESLTNAELQDRLRAAGLPTSGPKVALVARLAGHVTGQAPDATGDASHPEVPLIEVLAAMSDDELLLLAEENRVAWEGDRDALILALVRCATEAPVAGGADTGAPDPAAEHTPPAGSDDYPQADDQVEYLALCHISHADQHGRTTCAPGDRFPAGLFPHEDLERFVRDGHVTPLT